MNVTIIGVPYDLDRPYTGMGRAPDALLDAGLAQRLEAVGCATILAEMVDIPEGDDPREDRIGRLQTRVGYEVARSRAAGFFPIVVGGDCLNSLGTLAGMLDPANTGVVWLDAHGDFNTPETTISGYLGGMPLACAVGRGLDELRQHTKLEAPIPERNVFLLGARDLDPQEERELETSAVTLVRADELGADTAVLDRVLRAIEAFPLLYLHVDIDVLDPAEAPGVDYPSARGLPLATLQDIVRRIAGTGRLAALALTAVNPEKDIDGRTASAAISVVEAALDQVCRVTG
jgi:arginase